MSKTYNITNRRMRQQNNRLAFKGGAELVKFDFSQYAEENGALTTATWSVEYGDAIIASESLTSNVAQAQVTATNAGNSLIKLVVSDGTNINVQWLNIHVKDITSSFVDDYGLLGVR